MQLGCAEEEKEEEEGKAEKEEEEEEEEEEIQAEKGIERTNSPAAEDMSSDQVWKERERGGGKNIIIASRNAVSHKKKAMKAGNFLSNLHVAFFPLFFCQYDMTTWPRHPRSLLTG